jgi:hypothetical protein
MIDGLRKVISRPPIPKGLRMPIRRMAYNVEIGRWPRPESFPISSS